MRRVRRRAGEENTAVNAESAEVAQGLERVGGEDRKVRMHVSCVCRPPGKHSEVQGA